MQIELDQGCKTSFSGQDCALKSLKNNNPILLFFLQKVGNRSGLKLTSVFRCALTAEPPLVL